MTDMRGLLARVRRLERSHGATDEMREWVSDSFGAAIADGRMCPVDGPVVLRCLMNWINDGTARAGSAGWGPLQ